MEEIITESKISNFKLSKETKKYYDFIMKKLPKYEDKAKDKAKYKGIYNELRSRTSDLKKIYDEAFKLEKKFLDSDNLDEKRKLKIKYKNLGKESKDILNKSKKDFNKLRNLLIAGGMTAAAAAAVFAVADTYDDYMHSFTRLIDRIANFREPETFSDRLATSIAWKIYMEEVNYFPY